jgi:hypothetical protein
MIPRLRRLSGQPARQIARVGGVLALCGLSMAAAAWLFLGPAQLPESAARIAAATFASRLVDGTPDQAYDLLCAATRAELDRSDFAGWARRQAVSDYWIGAVLAEPQQQSAVVGARLTGSDGTARAVRFEVVAERGTWRVCAGPWA